MLAGKYYSTSDKELVLDRQRCNKVYWRFNNCTNPNNGVLPEERARHFGEILQLNKLTKLSPTLVLYTLSGCIGNNVIVEALFNCDYRYNIYIGYNIVIGKNCTILDLYKVKIGDCCILGPSVNIYTVMLAIDPKRRPGYSRLNLGKPIIIEEDCWIGRGVIILLGQTIKKGSTVGAGSVVTKVCLYNFLTFISLSTWKK
jgi:acetyltransferase-like isoleucine patch superfamily enzyme